MEQVLQWFSEFWDSVQPYLNWDSISVAIGYISAAIAILCFIFAILSKCKNTKIAKFASKALAILNAVKNATAKAETYAGASGEEKKEIAMALVKNQLNEANVSASDAEISEAIDADVAHTKEVNSSKKAEENPNEGRSGVQL